MRVRTVLLLVVVSMVLGGLLKSHAKAAEPAAPTPISENCEQVATVGIIEYYYCETDYGPDMLVNSLGFMVAVD